MSGLWLTLPIQEELILEKGGFALKLQECNVEGSRSHKSCQHLDYVDCIAFFGKICRILPLSCGLVC